MCGRIMEDYQTYEHVEYSVSETLPSYFELQNLKQPCIMISLSCLDLIPEASSPLKVTHASLQYYDGYYAF